LCLWLATAAFVEYGRNTRAMGVTDRYRSYVARLRIPEAERGPLAKRLKAAFSARCALMHHCDDALVTPELVEALDRDIRTLGGYELAAV
jgi:hypothetical protein